MEIAVFVLVMIFNKIYALESTEEDTDTNPYNSFAPSTSNLQEIYTNTFNRNNEDSNQNEDDFTVANIQMQSAEFHPGELSNTPAPKIRHKNSYKKKNADGSTDNMDEPGPFQVIPMSQKQRGVLDVLFPATRVKSFKNVFDSFRRILSYTFRK